MDSVYGKLMAAVCKIDSHESDLYVLATPEAEKILRASDHWPIVRRFTSNVDGLRWFDVPFAYLPFWEKRAGVREK